MGHWNVVCLFPRGCTFVPSPQSRLASCHVPANGCLSGVCENQSRHCEEKTLPVSHWEKKKSLREKARGVLMNRALLCWHYVCLGTEDGCTCAKTSSEMHPRSLLSDEHFAGTPPPAPKIQSLPSAAKHKGNKSLFLKLLATLYRNCLLVSFNCLIIY